MQQRMNETVDGEYQNYKAKGGAYTREHFFGKSPELLKMVENLSDADIMRLNRGGHDPFKVYAAYHAAVNHRGEPTVILAKTVKGYGMGEGGESENTTHAVKKLGLENLKHFRDQFGVPLTDDDLARVPYYRPGPDTPEMVYLRRNRERLGGFIAAPRRRRKRHQGAGPLASSISQLKGTGDREISTTMVFVRMLASLVRDKDIGSRVVPIVPDEARTFGMEGMFRQLGIYSSEGQIYEPEDSDEIAGYRESKEGQVLEEGINEAGAFSAWIAAATSYSSHRMTLVPFYIFYSMFGFQRIGDFAWAAGDIQARGFLLGGTAGRTTLNGEGLQHQDGHSHLLASTIPNCRSYDPTYGYELAIIVHHGLKRMYEAGDKVFYYITVMNEPYQQPTMPDGVEEGIVRGIYRLTPKVGRRQTSSVAGQRHDSARGHRRGRLAAGVRRSQRNLERDQFQRVAARRNGRRSLEHASPGRDAAEIVRRAVLRRRRCTGRCRDRLHEGVCGTDQGVRACAISRARHRWIRPQRHATTAAIVLRSRSTLRHGGSACVACRQTDHRTQRSPGCDAPLPHRA